MPGFQVYIVLLEYIIFYNSLLIFLVFSRPLPIQSLPFSAVLSVLGVLSLGTACPGPFLVGQRLGKYKSERRPAELVYGWTSWNGENVCVSYECLSEGTHSKIG